MLKPFLILSALVLTGVSAPPPQAQQPAAAAPAAAPAAEAKIPLEAVNQVNPVKANAESLARAKKIYGYECAVCHGDDGSGAGDLAKNMKAKMGDFRDPNSLKGHTDGELFYIIENGKGEMEGEGPRLKPEDTWNLVNYLRSLSKGAAPGARLNSPFRPPIVRANNERANLVRTCPTEPFDRLILKHAENKPTIRM